MLKRVLVANRGEIAVRVIRACRELGIGVIAVYSDADKDALHVEMADDAVHLGPAPSRESYLLQDKVIQAALAHGCDSIHPGYGFLSENPDFAQKVADAGLIFIGPTAAAMRRMGDKTSARREAAAAGVPTAPGSEALKDAAEARREAKRVGYPVMLKASAGGGGIGMRIVRAESEMEEQFHGATTQAQAAFGVPDVFLEKFIERPRHIEVQVLGDQHGHVIHLGERECSIQRRHQKLVEEAPSPALTPQQRSEIGAKAVALAKRVGYSNAGTMEFLYQEAPSAARSSGAARELSDSSGAGQFFFNEMNTRLQVEHPVTELVTGIDLVQWQLRIAAGEKLTLRQEDVVVRGHAFEARINAEDSTRSFAPSPGPVEGLRLPAGPGIRVDSGLREGWTVPSNYDSMVLKLLVHAGDRAKACDRMLRALDELHIQGFATNKAFHQALFANPTFRSGDISTRFLEETKLQDQLQVAAQAHARHAQVRLAAALAGIEAMPGGVAVLARQGATPRVVAAGTRRDWGTA